MEKQRKTYVKELLKERDMKVGELAAACGINRGNMSGYVNGHKVPKVGLAIRMSLALRENIFVMSREMGWIDGVPPQLREGGGDDGR